MYINPMKLLPLSRFTELDAVVLSHRVGPKSPLADAEAREAERVVVAVVVVEAVAADLAEAVAVRVVVAEVVEASMEVVEAPLVAIVAVRSEETAEASVVSTRDSKM